MADTSFELDEWEPHERDAVSRALGDAGIAHAWNGASLVVSRDDEVVVERILDEVDEALDVDLDPDADKVAYDLSSWPEDQRLALDGALADQGIPHGWSEDDELLVHEEDEQVVDGLIDSAASGELPTAGDGDGGAGAELLGELFVAADRLMHDPRDHEGTLALMDTARVALEAPPPYGFAPKQWDEILDAVGSLVLLIGDQAIDDDAVIQQATTVRTTLRPLV